MVILLLLIAYVLYREYLRDHRVEKTAPPPPALLVRATSPDRTRLWILGSVIFGTYSVAILWLNFVWYQAYKRSAFHWFDDRGEWNQMDKAGHIFCAYFQTVWAYELMRWGGVDNKRAAIIGALIGCGFESSIEMGDGFSTKWGASWSDLVANFIGASIALSQYLLWKEQRLLLKYSYHGKAAPDAELQQRADDLFGDLFIEKTLKDYNNMTLWVSVNPSKFVKRVKPEWFCISIGYGAENLYGGFENKWKDKEGKDHDRTELPRKRLLLLSLDADLPKLSKNDPREKGVFAVLNILKMPFPAKTIRLN